MPGVQHFVRSAEDEPLAVLGFGAAAWKTAPRDNGWDAATAFDRQQRKVPCPGSESNIWHPLHRSSGVCSTTAATPSVLYCLKPSATPPRFAGTCYRAANWIRVGKTQGQLDVINALPINC